MVAEVEGETGPDGFGRDVKMMIAYFYADIGLLIFTRAAKLKQAFHVLIEILDQVRLNTSMGETVSM